ncbi:MAG: glutamate-5-semialdehyde dehydrogenase, partial [Sphaerochaetaceae bacterium]|nr:glutamate-5-semialdehyde dehydrogenase [Sphaerochaetaceae bacterium]
NTIDLERSEREHLSEPLRKRLVFSEKKILGVCQGIRQIASMNDPLGKVLEKRLLDENLVLSKIQVPIGVIGMIFESRPDALVQIVSLALKSSNAIVLKGGREALETNQSVVEVMKEALKEIDAPSEWIVHLTSREDVSEMLGMNDMIDLVIPRGSNEFVQYVMRNSLIPVLGHADGLCALYIDEEADIQMALSVAVDSKCQYPSVCNAVETILVHESVASAFIPSFAETTRSYPVIIHGDEKTCRILPSAVRATEEDWDTEYLDYEVAVKIVGSMDEAIEHIDLHGSKHTDAIVTANASRAEEFLRRVDSADVFHNCSTRFADGFRYGLGAEVGISTQKIHARGPVGIEGLVTSKWLLRGSGQLVADYEGSKQFLHEDLPLDNEG